MENNKFAYTYTAPTERERKEAESIRKEYANEEKKTDKLARLRALDRKVKDLPKIIALSLGVIGTLVFGTGLAMILEWGLLFWGTLVALAGILPLAFAYPAYKSLLKKRKDKYREEIVSLSDEILSENG